MRNKILLILLFTCFCLQAGAISPTKSEWKGYGRYDFTYQDKSAIIVCPRKAREAALRRSGKPASGVETRNGFVNVPMLCADKPIHTRCL